MSRIRILPVVVLLGCGGGGSPAGLTLTGTVLSASGAPMTTAVLGLYEVPSETVEGRCVSAAFAYPSLTLLRDGVLTDASGKYSIDLTTTPLAPRHCLELQLRDLPETQTVYEGYNQIVFPSAREPIEVPTLRVWTGMSVAPSTGETTFAWTAPQELAGHPAVSYVVWARDKATRSMVWQAAAQPDGTRVAIADALLEDFEVDAAVIATAESKIGSSVFTYVQADAMSSAFKGTFVPPSRGASCTAVGGAPLGSTCPVTDGSMAFVELGAESLTIRLAAPLSAKRAVLRGLQVSDKLVVESSADGVTFSTVGEATPDHAPDLVGRQAPEPRHGLFDLSLASTQAVQLYRLRAVASTGTGRIGALAEVSLLP